MMYYLRLSLTLLIVCALAAGLLAYINSLTEPVIKERKNLEEIATREALIPGAAFEMKQAAADSNFVYYIATKDSLVAGYTFVCSGNGYAGPVKTMVGLDNQLKVITIKVIDQAETPGLGANCATETFPDRFKGKSMEELVVDKDGGSIASLTGATITTRAIANSIKDQIRALKTDLAASQTPTAEAQAPATLAADETGGIQ